MHPLKENHIYIIAEAGINHNGNKKLAFELIDAAADAGADAIKFQTYNSKLLATNQAPKATYQKQNSLINESQLDMLTKYELPKRWHNELKSYAKFKKIEFLSTPFDSESLSYLIKLNLKFLKIPSGELTNLPLIWQFARSGIPIILSTGMSTLSEIELALATITHGLHFRKEPKNLEEVWLTWGNSKYRSKTLSHVVILHCTSQYPADDVNLNLKCIQTISNYFGIKTGYSDHSDGIYIPIAATALGAKIIEKHITLNRNLPGPDHKSSLEPDNFKLMVQQIRSTFISLGDGIKNPTKSELNTKIAARKQIIAAQNIKQNTPLKRKDLTTARCGDGISAQFLWDLVGKNSNLSYTKGSPISNG